jgi:hypothetical protein
MAFDPWQGLTAAQMEDMRLNNPAEFKRREAMLNQPDASAKVIVFRNGVLVNDTPTRPE